MPLRRFAYLAAILTVLPATPALAATILFEESEFVASEWVTLPTINNDPPATASGQHVAAGGNTGAYWQTTLVHGNTSTFAAFNHWVGGPILNPAAAGAIQSISVSFDLIHQGLHDGTQGIDFAIVQGGIRYTSGTVLYLLATETAWTHETLLNAAGTGPALMSSLDFWRESGNLDTPNPADPDAHPDFSASGAPITFGFRVFQGGGAQTAVSGLDNLRITVETDRPDVVVPEPAALAIAVVGAVSVARRRRSAR